MKRHTIRIILAATLFGAMTLAACGGGGTPAPTPTPLEIKIDSTEFRFDPNTITVKVGQPVRVLVTNTGALEHTFTIEDLDVDEPTPIGKTVTVEFTPTKSGTFELICTVPGHKEAGMVGTVVVNP